MGLAARGIQDRWRGGQELPADDSLRPGGHRGALPAGPGAVRADLAALARGGQGARLDLPQ